MFNSPSFGTGPSSWMNVSQLEVLITTACDPSLHEPNYAQHLEVAEHINQKKANTPREAAMLLARLANHRNPHIGRLSLALLSTLVQSCGYPFHLQISTKEFLNELVRRFPERPPPFPGPVMQGILDLIHEWKEGICQTSRWKQDLGNIRDMHRLLTFKGYRFRERGRTVREENAAAAELKSATELEEEDRAAQSAKLQELIRRGTPRDLAAAQELMKSLAGANPDAKPDYRTQALTDLNKLESKVVLLGEMLDNAATGERSVSGDAYDQVAAHLIAARPKLQEWINSAETDDPESLDTFLQINDQINVILERHEALKRGDVAAARNPIPAEVVAQAQGSLIDFDDASSAPTSGAGSGADDLASLFGGGPSQSQPQPQVQPVHAAGTMGGMGDMSGFMSSGFSSAPLPGYTSAQNTGGSPPGYISPQTTSNSQLGGIALPGTPQPQPHQPQQQPAPFRMGPGMGGSQYFGGAGMSMAGGAGMTSPPNATANGMGGQAQSQPPPANQNQSGKDPFADLAGLF